MPGAFGQVLLLLRYEVEDRAKNRPLLHGNNSVACDRPAETKQGFAIHQVEEFDEGKIVHLAAAVLDQAGRGLDGLAFIEFEFDRSHGCRSIGSATVNQCASQRQIPILPIRAGHDPSC